jgi:hypothetical protein
VVDGRFLVYFRTGLKQVDHCPSIEGETGPYALDPVHIRRCPGRTGCGGPKAGQGLMRAVRREWIPQYSQSVALPGRVLRMPPQWGVSAGPGAGGNNHRLRLFQSRPKKDIRIDNFGAAFLTPFSRILLCLAT